MESFLFIWLHLESSSSSPKVCLCRQVVEIRGPNPSSSRKGVAAELFIGSSISVSVGVHVRLLCRVIPIFYVLKPILLHPPVGGLRKQLWAWTSMVGDILLAFVGAPMSYPCSKAREGRITARYLAWIRVLASVRAVVPVQSVHLGERLVP